MTDKKDENIEQGEVQNINWNKVYFAVELILAFYILVFYLLTNYFS